MHRLTSSLPAYAGHVIRINNGGTVFSTEVLEEKTSIYYSTPTFLLARRYPATRLLA